MRNSNLPATPPSSSNGRAMGGDQSGLHNKASRSRRAPHRFERLDELEECSDESFENELIDGLEDDAWPVASWISGADSAEAEGGWPPTVEWTTEDEHDLPPSADAQEVELDAAAHPQGIELAQLLAQRAARTKRSEMAAELIAAAVPLLVLGQASSGQASSGQALLPLLPSLVHSAALLTRQMHRHSLRAQIAELPRALQRGLLRLQERLATGKSTPAPLVHALLRREVESLVGRAVLRSAARSEGRGDSHDVGHGAVDNEAYDGAYDDEW